MRRYEDLAGVGEQHVAEELQEGALPVPPGPADARLTVCASTRSGRRLTSFRRLVLGCMDIYDSESRFILQHFSTSTRSAFLRNVTLVDIEKR